MHLDLNLKSQIDVSNMLNLKLFSFVFIACLLWIPFTTCARVFFLLPSEISDPLLLHNHNCSVTRGPLQLSWSAVTLWSKITAAAGYVTHTDTDSKTLYFRLLHTYAHLYTYFWVEALINLCTTHCTHCFNCLFQWIFVCKNLIQLKIK